jgi:hypothetical protein
MNFLSSSTGKYFKKIYNTVFDDNNLIQQTCSPNIGYLEGLENITAFKDENKEISKLRDEFNKLLHQYEREYITYIENLFYVDYLQSLGQYQKLKNNVISDTEDNKYYITDYGILRKMHQSGHNISPILIKNINKEVKKTGGYDLFRQLILQNTEAKKQLEKKLGIKDPTILENTINFIETESTAVENACPNVPAETNVSNDILKIFARGTDINKNIGCSITFGNVKNSKGKAGFVDIYGKLHEYKDFPNNIPSSCPKDIVEISDIKYDSFVKGTPINSKDSMCFNPDINIRSYDSLKTSQTNLNNMNNMLKNISKRLLQKIQEVDTNDDTLKNKLDKNKQDLSQKIQNLDKDQTKINVEMAKLIEYKKEHQDVQIKYRQSLIKYSIATALSIVGVYATYKIIKYKSQE